MSPTWKSWCFFSEGCGVTSTESERDGVFLPMETRILVFHRRLGMRARQRQARPGRNLLICTSEKVLATPACLSTMADPLADCLLAPQAVSLLLSDSPTVVSPHTALSWQTQYQVILEILYLW